MWRNHCTSYGCGILCPAEQEKQFFIVRVLFVAEQYAVPSGGGNLLEASGEKPRGSIWPDIYGCGCDTQTKRRCHWDKKILCQARQTKSSVSYSGKTLSSELIWPYKHIYGSDTGNVSGVYDLQSDCQSSRGGTAARREVRVRQRKAWNNLSPSLLPITEKIKFRVDGCLWSSTCTSAYYLSYNIFSWASWHIFNLVVFFKLNHICSGATRRASLLLKRPPSSSTPAGAATNSKSFKKSASMDSAIGRTKSGSNRKMYVYSCAY